MDKINSSDIELALANSDPRVVRYALSVLKTRIDTPEFAHSGRLNLALQQIPMRQLGAAVNLQWLLNVARQPELLDPSSLTSILQNSGQDRWILRALSFIHGQRTARLIFEALLAEASSSPSEASYASTKDILHSAWKQIPVKERDGILEPHMQRISNKEASEIEGVDILLIGLSRNSTTPQISQRAEAAITGIYNALHQPSLPAGTRTRFLSLIGTGINSDEADLRALGQLLASDLNREEVSTCIARMRGLPSASVAELLLKHWGSFTIGQRSQATTVMAASGDGILQLVQALESGTIQAVRYVGEYNTNASTILESRFAHESASRSRNPYRANQGSRSVHQENSYPGGQRRRSRTLQNPLCGLSPAAEQEGFTRPATREPEALDDRSMVDGCSQSQCQCRTQVSSINHSYHGRSNDSGTIIKRGEAALEVASSNGERVTIDTVDIREIAPTLQSLMPEGFEEKLTPAQLADLLGYLRKK